MGRGVGWMDRQVGMILTTPHGHRVGWIDKQVGILTTPHGAWAQVGGYSGWTFGCCTQSL